MAAIGKMLRKGNSVHQTAQYEKLAQDPSDNEEEDDILFKREALLKQNGHSQNSQNGIVGECIEMTNADKNSTIKTDTPTAEELNLVKFKVVKRATALWRTRVSCFVLLLVLVLLLGLTLAFIVPYFRNVKKITIHYTRTRGWNKTFEDIGTESSVRLYDLDGDSLEDVIIGLQYPFAEKIYKDVDEMKALCQSEGLKYPCEGEVVALRGTDGYILWRVKTHSGITDINCDTLDVNKDGHKDCVVSGYHGTLTAINSKTGAMLWNIDENAVNIDWNMYQVLPIGDWNNDGITELLVAHGGSNKYGPELTITKEDLLDRQQQLQQPQQKSTSQQKVKDDEGGRLFVLSGSTGKLIGRYMDIPRNRDIFCPPIMHTTFDRSKYIIFGSGGIREIGSDGSLYIMSVPDLYRYVMNDTKAKIPGSGPGAYKGWDNLPVNSANVYQIYKSDTKGVLVPPICVDINKDGVKDLLLNAYDGNITMYNGENLTVMWQSKFPGFESYSTPAPGHFNDDDTVDFMVHLNYGKWPDYLYSLTVILDGKTGTKLWSLNSTMIEHSSDLVLKTKNKNRDAFLFRVQGTSSKGEKKRDNKESDTEKRQKRAAPYSQQYRPYPYDMNGYRRPGVYQPEQQQQQQPRYQTRTRVYNKNDGAQFPGNTVPVGTKTNPQQYYQDAKYNPYNRYPFNLDDTRYENPGYEPNYEDQYQDYAYLPDFKSWIEKFGHYADIEGEEDLFKSQSECVEDLAKYKTAVFLMDRSNIWMPLKVFETTPYRVYYNLTSNEESSKQKRDVSWIRPQKPDERGQLCIVMKPIERVNGAIGDLDGDGKPDLIALVNLHGQLTDESGFHVKNIAETRIIKINLADVMQEKRLVPLNVTLSGGMKAVKNSGGSILNTDFLPMKQQPWLAYMGTHGDSVYGSRH